MKTKAIKNLICILIIGGFGCSKAQEALLDSSADYVNFVVTQTGRMPSGLVTMQTVALCDVPRYIQSGMRNIGNLYNALMTKGSLTNGMSSDQMCLLLGAPSGNRVEWKNDFGNFSCDVSTNGILSALAIDEGGARHRVGNTSSVRSNRTNEVTFNYEDGKPKRLSVSEVPDFLKKGTNHNRFACELIRALIADGHLYEGMPLDNAVAILGEPSRHGMAWYYNTQGRHIFPCLSAEIATNGNVQNISVQYR